METGRQVGGEIRMRRDARRVAAWVSVVVLAAWIGGGFVRPASASEVDAPTLAPPDTAAAATVDSTGTDATTESLASGWKYHFDMTAPQNDKFGVTDRNFYLY